MVCLLAMASVAAAEIRTWTFEKNGRTIDGEITGFAGEAVNLRRPDGQTVSVPIAYLTASNRTEVAAQRAALWKEIEVLKLEGPVSAGGRYKKCQVIGHGIAGTILIELLPSSVEATLSSHEEEAATIADAAAGIEGRKRQIERAEALLPEETGIKATYLILLNANYADLNRLRRELKDAEAKLARLQAAHAANITNTVAARTIKAKNTGLVYERCPVWRCADPRRPEQ